MMKEPDIPLLPNSISNNSALVSKFSKSKKSGKLWCDYCQKPQHTREKCQKLHGKAGNSKPKFSPTSKGLQAATASFSNETETTHLKKGQLDQLYRLLASNKLNSTPNSIPSTSFVQKGNPSHALLTFQTGSNL